MEIIFFFSSVVDQSYSLADPSINMDEAHPQPTVFEGELKSYQLKVNSHAITCSEFKLTCTYVCLLIEFGACVASGGWVPMGQGAVIAITPQGGRTPTGLPSPPPPHYSTCHTEAETRKKKSQEGGGDPKPRKQREGGEPREMLHYLHY